MEPPQNLSDFHQNLGSLPELVMGLTFWGSKTRFIPNMSILGGPRTSRKSSWRALELQNCEKTVILAAYDDLLGFSPPRNLPKIDPSSFRLLLGPLPAPLLVPKWYQTGVRELEIQPLLPLSSTSSLVHTLYLTIHVVIYHMEFNRTLHPIKALL